jgi:hypothetical protein
MLAFAATRSLRERVGVPKAGHRQQQHNNKKARPLRPGFLVVGSLTMTYFRMQRSTLSSARLRFTALFGMGRGGTRVLWSSENLLGLAVWVDTLASWPHAGRSDGLHDCIASWNNSQSYRIKPHGQLVRLSLTHYCASTWRLSTLWSSTNLQGTYVPGSLILRQVSRLDAFSGYLFRT